MANNLYLVLEENRRLMMMRVSGQMHAAGEAFYVHRRLQPPRDRPKPFQSFPDKTGVCNGERWLNVFLLGAFISTDIRDQYLISSTRLNQRV